MKSSLTNVVALGLGLTIATSALAAPSDQARAQRQNLSEATGQFLLDAPTRVSAKPEQIAQLLRTKGLSVEVSTDNEGDPVLSSRSQGVTWSVYFYGCESGQNCNAITFDSGYSATSRVTLEKLNAWNTTKRYAYAVQRNDGSFAIRMDVLLSTGVSPEHWQHSYQLWETQLGAFLRHIEY